MLDVETLGRLVAHIGKPGFDMCYFDLAKKTLDVSKCTAFAFTDGEAPAPIILEGTGPMLRGVTRTLGAAYVETGFRSDPQVKELYGVSELQVRLTTPATIDDDDYRRHYYDEPNIVSEISVLGHFGRKRFSIGFYRTAAKRPFSMEDLNRAQDLATLSLPLLHRHLELSPADIDQEDPAGRPAVQEGYGKPVLEHLSAVLMAEGCGLTPREAQVCASIVLGYRTLAISLNLGISENTICTHRKRAYAKLGISSQNELFSRYFRTVARLKAQAA